MAAAQPEIPLTETSDNARKIPKCIFIENIDQWVEKYGGQELFQAMEQLYQKYKFMEQQLVRGKASLKVKMPDIKKTLEMVQMLKDKNEKGENDMTSNFLISDNIWTRAKLNNTTGKVGLWLGANVMVEYTYDEATALLHKNKANALTRLEATDADLNFLKDQITTMEVNMARTHNQTVVNKEKNSKEGEKKAE